MWLPVVIYFVTLSGGEHRKLSAALKPEASYEECLASGAAALLARPNPMAVAATVDGSGVVCVRSTKV